MNTYHVADLVRGAQAMLSTAGHLENSRCLEPYTARMAGSYEAFLLFRDRDIYFTHPTGGYAILIHLSLSSERTEKPSKVLLLLYSRRPPFGKIPPDRYIMPQVSPVRLVSVGDVHRVLVVDPALYPAL